MYINTYGEIPVTLRIISKDDKTLIYHEDLNGDYEGLEVETVDDAFNDIFENIGNYYASLSAKIYPSNNGMDDKLHYIGVFSEYFNMDYTEAIKNYYDLEIRPVLVDTSKLKIEID